MSEKNRTRFSPSFFMAMYRILKLSFESSPKIAFIFVIIRIQQSLYPIFFALILRYVIDQLTIANTATEYGNLNGLILAICLLGLVAFISQVATSYETYFREELGRQIELHASKQLYGHLISLPGIKNFETPETHDVIHMATDNVDWLPSNVIFLTSNIIVNCIIILSFIGVISFINPLLSVLIILSSIPALIVRFHFGKKRYDNAWFNSPNRRLSDYLRSVLSHPEFVKELRLYNSGHFFLAKFSQAMEKTNNDVKQIAAKEVKAFSLINGFEALTYIVSIFYIMLESIAKQVSIGDVVLVIDSIRNLQTSLNSLVETAAEMNERTLLFDYFQRVLEIQSTLQIKEPKKQINKLKNKITFENVSFKYHDDSKYIIKNINFQINKGETLALVGRNGSGKTTLIKLLLRFYDPTGGRILWDGVDIRHFDPIELRRHCSAIFQDFVRYDLTMRENIVLSNVDDINNIKRVKEVAKTLGIAPLVEDFDHGFDTLLSLWLTNRNNDSDHGIDLSGGQWQKVAIARALFRSSDVLALDEPTSALDAESEAEVFAEFRKVVDLDKTNILISHRFSTVRVADRILVLQDGHIIEEGTHEHLLNISGTYAYLYHLQASQYYEAY